MSRAAISKTSIQAAEEEREKQRKISIEAARRVFELSLIEEFEPLKYYEDVYEISRKYPHHIRRIKDERPLKEHNNGNGYMHVSLNNGGKKSQQKKHRLIAIQWIPTENIELEIDHDNQHRDDNHIENLLRSTRSNNLKNRRKYSYKREPLDSIPEDSIEVDHYGKHKLENYYFHDDVFYRFNGRRYYPLNPIANEYDGLVYVNARDIYNKSLRIFYSKFKRDYAEFLEREDSQSEVCNANEEDEDDEI